MVFVYMSYSIDNYSSPTDLKQLDVRCSYCMFAYIWDKIINVLLKNSFVNMYYKISINSYQVL